MRLADADVLSQRGDVWWMRILGGDAVVSGRVARGWAVNSGGKKTMCDGALAGERPIIIVGHEAHSIFDKRCSLDLEVVKGRVDGVQLVEMGSRLETFRRDAGAYATSCNVE